MPNNHIMNGNTRRRVLIIAAEFPPVKGIGRMRPLKFCQHLPSFGWDAAVLTLSQGDMEPVDLSTLDEIPEGTPIYRAQLPKPKDRVVQFLKGGKQKPAETLPASSIVAEKSEDACQVPPPKSRLRSMLGSMLGIIDRIAHRYLLIPDDLVLWSGSAVRVGEVAVREFQPDIILATAPYFTDLIVGARLSQKTGIPWVADYRDLWTGDVLREWVPPWRRRLEIMLERHYVSTASSVVTVSEPKTQVVRERMSSLAKERFVTITNGYDPEEFEGVVAEGGESDMVRVVYAGRLFKNRRGYELLEAMGELLREAPEARHRIRFEYYGGVTPEISVRMSELIAEYGLDGIFNFSPDVPYARSKALQKGADVLLLIVDGGATTSGVIPGKLFEYVAAGPPMLCLAAEGATSEIIRRGGLGWVVPPGDILALKTVLQNFVENGTALCSPDTDFIGGFERRKLVQRLAEVLNQVVDEPMQPMQN